MTERVVAGRFRLEARLGTGGFGEVWSAFDEKLQVEVAVKKVLLDPTATAADRESAVAEAEAEARHAARIRDHPNVVAVYDVVTDNEVPWLVMRLVKGRTLAQEVKEHGPLDPGSARDIATGVLAALEAAHAAGIVHRDVKPANIMRDARGTVLLTDFGIARQSTTTTQTVLIGTLPYMSPERLNGKDTPAGDLFALGVCLYELTEGASPFARSTPTAIITAVTLDQPAPPRNAGPLAPLVLALLDKDPGRRPTAGEALSQLIRTPTVVVEPPRDDARPAHPAPVPPPPSFPPHRPPRPFWLRHRRAAIATGAVAAGAIAAVLALLLSQSPPPSAPATLTDPQGQGVNAIAWGPNDTLAAGDDNGDIYLWDTAAKHIIATLLDPGGTSVTSVGFGPDGTLATSDSDGHTYLWNTTAERITTTLTDPGDSSAGINSIAFGPDGTLATGDSDGHTYLWNTTTRHLTATLTDPGGTDGNSADVYSVAFDSDSTLATGDEDGHVYLWNTTTKRITATFTDPNDTEDVNSVAWGPNGTLAVGDQSGDTYLWNTTTKRVVATLSASSSSDVYSVAFGPGDTLAVGDGNGDTYLWDTTTKQTTATIAVSGNDSVSSVAFGPDDTIAVGTGRQSEGGSTYLRKIASGS